VDDPDQRVDPSERSPSAIGVGLSSRDPWGSLLKARDADLADSGISLSRAREGYDGARIIRLQWRV
jgi:hypothetical protein